MKVLVLDGFGDRTGECSVPSHNFNPLSHYLHLSCSYAMDCLAKILAITGNDPPPPSATTLSHLDKIYAMDNPQKPNGETPKAPNATPVVKFRHSKGPTQMMWLIGGSMETMFRQCVNF